MSMSDSDRMLLAFRRWGYLQADLDWLERVEPIPHRELDEWGEEADSVRRIYCGTLAAEFEHIPDPERRQWVIDRLESPPPTTDRPRALELLLRGATFEQLLQTKYLGNKRFSIEGIESLLPLLVEMIEEASRYEARQAVMAMAHRGRLNVMAHVVGRDYAELFAGFEDVNPRSVMGGGDVKYHLGATGMFRARNGHEIKTHLVSNPSHLEAVYPVAMGRVRAKQERFEDDRGRLVVPIIMHGDAAFAGQGITAETLNFSDVTGFSVGGTVHVIVNNMIGFTTEPSALQSSLHASDIAKRLPIPVFHVNAEDPDAAMRAAHLALAYRYEFASDVVINLIGFRRHGHSEVDDPTITQPGLYSRIRERPLLWESYAEELGVGAKALKDLAAKIREELEEGKAAAEELEEIPRLYTLPDYWDTFDGGPYRHSLEVDTGIAEEELERLGEALTSCPDDFNIHPKVAKLLEMRAEMARGERPIDFGMAEALALASLVEEGHPIRLSGQDSRRGTFSHRHSALIDVESGETYRPLQNVSDGQARVEIFDSVLSEAAVLGFEYGFSRDYPEALVAWEAQFGDFANGAQTIFDQFVTAGEDKWGLLSGLIVLLPHGYEGQGPEHSSARMERFLQLAAEDAIQIAQPSTACQYFHLLRRQVLRKWRKPLIVFTPKSMLRHSAAASPRRALARDRFWPVWPELDLQSAERILLCTGKIRHALRAEREKRGDRRTAVIAIEQLYPFPENELTMELDKFSEARDLRWVQEEPANMGALFYVEPRIRQLARGRHLRTIKRSRSASPATGSAKAHELEQTTLINLAFSG
jgi:2-oxoglutarate dehydrogenase E1 component